MQRRISSITCQCTLATNRLKSSKHGHQRQRSFCRSISAARRMPLDSLEVTWLGTCAGSPSRSRNVSNTVLRLDGELWLVDVGEATQHQFQRSKLKIHNTTKIFLTHMHGDHTFGLVPLLCALADAAGGVTEGSDPRDAEAAKTPPIDIYGLRGTRRLVRTMLECTYTHLARRYRVNELLFEDEEAYGGELHHNELAGRDIRIDVTGAWRDFLDPFNKMQVSAVPIKHTVRCAGYIFTEPPRPGTMDPQLYLPAIQRNAEALKRPPYSLKNPVALLSRIQKSSTPIDMPDGTQLPPPPMIEDGRKIVLLGDTYDASSDAMDELASDADLLVHEATNAYLPGLDDAIKAEDTYETIAARSRSHGHSTPQVAGGFARRVRARQLFLNHLSSRYIDAGFTLDTDDLSSITLSDAITIIDVGRPADIDKNKTAGRVHQRVQKLQMIEDQATETWSKQGLRAVATRDFMTVIVRRRKE